MKTTILDDLELPEKEQAAFRREAVRRRVPVSYILKERLLTAARQINQRAQKDHKSSARQAKHVGSLVEA